MGLGDSSVGEGLVLGPELIPRTHGENIQAEWCTLVIQAQEGRDGQIPGAQ